MNDNPEAEKSPSLSAIFKVFLVIGLTAFGGGASAHIHDAVVHREKWLDNKRFLEGMTVARIVPTVRTVSNLAAFVGAILAGYRGALVAVGAVAVLGLFLVLLLAVAYGRFAGALAGTSSSVCTGSPPVRWGSWLPWWSTRQSRSCDHPPE